MLNQIADIIGSIRYHAHFTTEINEEKKRKFPTPGLIMRRCKISFLHRPVTLNPLLL